MFSNENSFTYVLLAALALAVVTTFVALFHAFYGLQLFW
jgi:hypothetical protein